MQTFASLIWSLFTNMFDLKFLITLYITYDKDQKSCMKNIIPDFQRFSLCSLWIMSIHILSWGMTHGRWHKIEFGDDTKLSWGMTQNWLWFLLHISWESPFFWASNAGKGQGGCQFFARRIEKGRKWPSNTWRGRQIHYKR